MRSVQPSADLPANNSQTMLGYNSLPARPQRTTARNMTGIYLGSESSRVRGSPRHSIPPLAKPRGVTVGTAAERRRQLNHRSLDSSTRPRQGDGILDPDCISNTLLYVYHHQPTPAPIPLPYTPPMILRLPILRPKQQQRVEALRLREEPRGFNPLPVKKPTKPKTKRTEHFINNSSEKHALDYSGITKKTGRNFVPVANSGVKRLEDLRSEVGSIIIGNCSVKNGHDNAPPHHPSPVLDKTNVNKNLVGLEDCYKRICKGNLSNLQHVMQKKGDGNIKTRTRLISTPLTIRSFRNPQNPHPVVQYTDPKFRPKTTIATTVNRPPVPAPYYYSSKTLPRTADDGSNRVKLSRDQGIHHNHHNNHVLAAPGAGVLSASSYRKHKHIPTDSNSGMESRPPSGISGSRPPCMPNNAKIYDSDEMNAQRDGFRVPSGTPAASQTDLTKLDRRDDVHQYSEQGILLKQSSQVSVPPPSPATLHRMKVSSANKNNCGSDYDSEFDTRDGVESTISLPTIGTRPGTRAEHKMVDSGIEEQDEGDDGGGMRKVAIVISVEDEMGRHIDVDIEDEAGHVHQAEKTDSSEEKTVDTEDAVSNEGVSAENGSQEEGVHKKSELQQLIEEHNELVLHIEELEKMKTTFSDDDLSSSEDESPAPPKPSA